MANAGWWEIQVLGVAELEESICWRLQEFGCQGTASQTPNQTFSLTAAPVAQVGQVNLRQTCGYRPQSQSQIADLDALAQDLYTDAQTLGLPPPTVTWSMVAEQDWASSWQQYWHPQDIGNRLLICPAWLEPPPGNQRLVLRLNPGVAFGTGTHATTQLCLDALERRFVQSTTPGIIADIGCGTGILSIAAILLGATQAYAVDTDPLAVDSTLGSLALNQISPTQVHVSQGSAGDIPGPVDGIVCNILAGVIIELMPEITALAQPDTWAIFSGLLTSQAEQVSVALAQYGWQVEGQWSQGDWACLAAAKKSTPAIRGVDE